MFAYINGLLVQKDPAQAILDVNGVGYLLRISVHTFEQIKHINQGKCRLHTWLHVKEDAHTLYGFATADEKALFLHLISISGVGPGTGLMMLSHTSPQELFEAIVSGDVRSIQAIKGIGPKTAQRIVLELRDKLQKSHWLAAAGLSEDTNMTLPDGQPAPAESSIQKSSAEARNNRELALAALITLGIARAQAEKNLDTIIKRDGPMLTVEELVKRALRS